MFDRLRIRELDAIADLSATIELQRAVWQMVDAESSSPHLMNAVIHNGGSVIAAEVDGRMVGFCFGFAAKRGDDLWLWSHMAGVHPNFQGWGIGCRLKQAQREWALRQGYRVMAWTFDPLQSGNANFNFNRLGVKAKRYYVNHYGEMSDGINAGLASDRLEAVWQLDAPSVVAIARGAAEPAVGRADDVKLVYVDEKGALCKVEPPGYTQKRYSIEIPLNVAELKQSDIEYTKRWQLYLREAMTALFEAGYVVCEFVRRDKAACWYVMCQDETA